MIGTLGKVLLTKPEQMGVNDNTVVIAGFDTVTTTTFAPLTSSQ
jgi:hypothetical protein